MAWHATSMLKAFPPSHLPFLSRSFLTSRCQRNSNNKFNPDDVRKWLRLKQDATCKRAGEMAQNTFANLALLGGKLNQISGYEEIEVLKRKVTTCENKIQESREIARAAKTTYEAAVLRRSRAQKEVNDLLQRKSSWSDKDLVRFTSLVREEHTYEQEELQAKGKAASSEQAVDQSFDELIRSILSRYHEEQVWSDKIRSGSTYGSLAALGLNLLVFILAVLIVEPWKRRRLAQTFEKRIQELSEETQQLVDSGIQNLLRHVEQQEELLSTMRELLPKEKVPSVLETIVEDGPEEAIIRDDPIRSLAIAHQTTLKSIGFALLGAISSQVLLSLLR